jgi:two-component system OmpR family response regulator
MLTTARSLAYGRRLSRALGETHFVLDISRNGRGPLREPAQSQPWCNPPGRALGQRPRTSTGQPGVDPYLWIKQPGHSDGTCRGGPPAGTWWPDYALRLELGEPPRKLPASRAARVRYWPGMSEPHRVLVVDDEPNIVDVISIALRFHGFAVESAGTGADALAAVERFRPHLVLLDVMLPDMEGFDVATRLGAQRAPVPIVYLTARDATEDKVRGLTLGGDDYVTKPFSLEELIARIRSILRRSGLAEPESSRLVFEDLVLDEDAHEVSRAGEPIDLTATEYRLLRYLMLNPRRVLTRAQLLEHVWNYDFGGDARVLETYVSYLRRKLDAQGPPLIQTVRGVGYALRRARA